MLLVLVGCTVEGRPRGAEYTVEEDEMYFVKPALRGSVPARLCEPGSTRKCKYYYWTKSGQVNCPEGVQICRRDGYGWHRCNDLDPKETEPVTTEEEPPIEETEDPLELH